MVLDTLKKTSGGLTSGFVTKMESMKGEPHFVAMGMAVGIFVSMTPTIPFHTLAAVILAYLFKGSRPAAMLGVWVSNPFTLVFFYLACYKIGMLIFGASAGDPEILNNLLHQMESDALLCDKIYYLFYFFRQQIRVCLVMLAGGVILGIPTSIAAYFVTRRFMIKLHLKKLKKMERKRKK